MNFKDVPLPQHMQGLLKDERGFPIPFTVLVDAKKVTHFKINDSRKTDFCIEHRLCTICGVKLVRGNMWFIGGQLSAFHPKGAFNDPPVHYECGKYALQVCPYLAYTQYAAKEIDHTKVAPESKGTMVFYNPTQDMERLEFFCFVQGWNYKITTGPLGVDRFIQPEKPYYKIEYWKDGKQITLKQANDLLEAKDKESYLPYH